MAAAYRKRSGVAADGGGSGARKRRERQRRKRGISIVNVGENASINIVAENGGGGIISSAAWRKRGGIGGVMASKRHAA